MTGTDEIAAFYRTVLADCGWLTRPFAPRPADLLDAHVVHDLGIAGDDFDDFVMARVARRPVPPVTGNLKPFIPGETSGDAFRVAMADCDLARRFSRIERFSRRAIRRRPLTLRELDALLYPPPTPTG